MRIAHTHICRSHIIVRPQANYEKRNNNWTTFKYRFVRQQRRHWRSLLKWKHRRREEVNGEWTSDCRCEMQSIPLTRRDSQIAMECLLWPGADARYPILSIIWLLLDPPLNLETHYACSMFLLITLMHKHAMTSFTTKWIRGRMEYFFLTIFIHSSPSHKKISVLITHTRNANAKENDDDV